MTDEKEKKLYTSLSISRLPVDTAKRFKELAIEFCDDYGMTLKALIDRLDGFTQVILGMEERLTALEDGLQKMIEPIPKIETQEENVSIKSISGKQIKK